MTDNKTADQALTETLYWVQTIDDQPMPGKTIQTRYIGGVADGMVVTTNAKPDDATWITEPEYRKLTTAQTQNQVTAKSSVRARNAERLEARKVVISKIAAATGLTEAEIEVL